MGPPFWVVGGIDPMVYDAGTRSGKVDELPANHAPDFAPVLNPTLRTGVEAMLVASSAWVLPAGTAPP